MAGIVLENLNISRCTGCDFSGPCALDKAASQIYNFVTSVFDGEFDRDAVLAKVEQLNAVPSFTQPCIRLEYGGVDGFTVFCSAGVYQINDMDGVLVIRPKPKVS